MRAPALVVSAALFLSAMSGRPAAPKGSVAILVEKGARRMTVTQGSRVVATYAIALGANPVGPKQKAGDKATPEGEYFVTHENDKSAFHRSLGLAYPNAADADRGLAAGLLSKAEHAAITSAIARGERPPQHTALGGDIFLHGGGTDGDWTFGCVALANADIDALARMADKGTKVRIVP